MNIFGKQILLSMTLILIAGFVQAGELGDFLRHPNGKLKIVKDYYRAEEACCMENGYSSEKCHEMSREEKFKLNIRLPTIRELAEEATKYGLTISKEPEGLKRDSIRGVNPDGTVDEFYSNFENYKPSGEMGENLICSATDYLEYNYPNTYHFFGFQGRIWDVHREAGFHYAVRCMNSSKTGNH